MNMSTGSDTENFSSHKIANTATECNKDALLDKHKLHLDIHFGGIEISQSAFIGLFRLILGLIRSLIQGTDISGSPGIISIIFSFVLHNISGLNSEQEYKPDSTLLKVAEQSNNINKYYIIPNGENINSFSSNQLSLLYSNILEPNNSFGNHNLRDEKDLSQTLLNDSTRQDLTTDKENDKRETSQQTEMSVHIKSDASPRNLRNVQGSPKEKLTVDDTEDFYRHEPKVHDKLKKLVKIKRDAEKWAEEVAKFDGDHKTFLHIQEMLLRDIDAVDLIYADGKEVIKQRKRDIVIYVQEELDKLEVKNKNISKGM